MKFFNELKKIDRKLIKITRIGYIFCLLLALLGVMILSLYHCTYLLFQFDLGFTILKLSVFFFVGFSICCIAFNRILDDIN